MEPLTIISTIISALGATVSIYFALRSSKQGERNLAIQEETAKRNDKALEIGYRLKVQDWVSQVIDCMADAYILSEYEKVDTDFERQRIGVMADLTSLLDQGRMFFPNIDADWGNDKPVAYQGLRQDILNPIKASFDLVKGMKGLTASEISALGPILVKFRREFVSYSHDKLLLKDREQFFNNLVTKA
jgi:hypothetical protein